MYDAQLLQRSKNPIPRLQRPLASRYPAALRSRACACRTASGTAGISARVCHRVSSGVHVTDASDDYEFTIFPDGRAIIKGTDDTDKARTLYAKYIGH